MACTWVHMPWQPEAERPVRNRMHIYSLCRMFAAVQTGTKERVTKLPAIIDVLILLRSLDDFLRLTAGASIVSFGNSSLIVVGVGGTGTEGHADPAQAQNVAYQIVCLLGDSAFKQYMMDCAASCLPAHRERIRGILDAPNVVAVWMFIRPSAAQAVNDWAKDTYGKTTHPEGLKVRCAMCCQAGRVRRAVGAAL